MQTALFKDPVRTAQ